MMLMKGKSQGELSSALGPDCFIAGYVCYYLGAVTQQDSPEMMIDRYLIDS